MNIEEVQQLIAAGENLHVEFKSDRNSLPDRDLLSAVVALANTDGGHLFLGIEDDGKITGLHANHRNLQGLNAMISNRTHPSVPVQVTLIKLDQLPVGWIQVPKSRQIVATSDGVVQRRRLMANGKPEAVPFLPHEYSQRQAALGQMDPSATPLMELTSNDLSPLERERVREIIRRYGGDVSLLPLSDEELDGALGLTMMRDGIKYPTLAGLLLLGREETLRQYLPAHEVGFQELQGTDVRTNIFLRKPLLVVFEEIEQLFRSRVVEQEVESGLFRVPVPNFERRAFREAFVNALVHRDYMRLGAVHVRLDDDGLTISNPGGFVEGVTLENLLVTEPRPRNPLLADIAKRLGLAERTGRGIDRIFEGMLRYGRPAPDYSRSSTSSVIVRLSNAASDLAFLELVLREEERTQRPMPLDSLLILSRLRQERRLTTAELAQTTQKSEQETRVTLERLKELGLAESHGSGRGRTYTLSAKVYRQEGQLAGYVRQAGFDQLQQEQMVLSYIDKHGNIRRADVMDLCRLTKDQAYKLLLRLKTQGLIKQEGELRGTIYLRNS